MSRGCQIARGTSFLLGYGKNRKQIPQWRREGKAVFPEGNNRGGGQGRPRMASPAAQVKSGHEYLALRGEELTAPGRSVLGILCMDAACGRQ